MPRSASRDTRLTLGSGIRIIPSISSLGSNAMAHAITQARAPAIATGFERRSSTASVGKSYGFGLRIGSTTRISKAKN
jgi:hypothetical protein